MEKVQFVLQSYLLFWHLWLNSNQLIANSADKWQKSVLTLFAKDLYPIKGLEAIS